MVKGNKGKNIIDQHGYTIMGNYDNEIIIYSRVWALKKEA